MIAPAMLRRCLLVLAGLGSSCAGGAEQDPRPSVVLILVDQLRADAAERWLVQTRDLAERGVRFTGMRAAAPWTYPSVVSLLSGLYPQQHGADANQEGTLLTAIDEAVPLLPRTLRSAGYRSAAFVTNPFLHESNTTVREAFDDFDASFIGDQGLTRGHGAQVWTERMYADSVNPAVRAHFDARPPTGPEFVYVHYIDVHGRKEGPERWRDAPFEPSYEAAVRHVDGRIRELYDYFLARYDGQVIFLVTSDHGQDLGDDLTVGDGPPWRARKASLHDFNLRIPFWVLPSRLCDGPRVVEAPCSNVDVVPTLLDWLGLPGGAGPGTSLLPAIRGAGYDGASRALYARNSTGGRFEECIVHGHTKFIRYRWPPDGAVLARRLFDLGADPREIGGLGAESTAEETLLEEAGGTHGLAFEARFQELDPVTRERLQELGYGGEEGR